MSAAFPHGPVEPTAEQRAYLDEVDLARTLTEWSGEGKDTEEVRVRVESRLDAPETGTYLWTKASLRSEHCHIKIKLRSNPEILAVADGLELMAAEMRKML